MFLRTMKDLLVDQLDELYAAEAHRAVVLPKLASAASSSTLSAVLRSHAEQSDSHVSRLMAAFNALGVTPRAPTSAESEGMKGLCADCMTLAGAHDAEPHVRDAALIAITQHVAHHEIAGYGCARTWARLLGYDQAASELQEALSEERRGDKDLSRLSEDLNRTALTPAAC
jgi:ferritin-like metal-binding protein YciE